MDEQTLEETEQVLELEEDEGALVPHKYPLWVKLFAAGIILATVYSLVLLPKYIVASRKMKAARAAYRNKDYDEAVDLYGSVLQTVPSSKAACIGAAEAIFSKGDKDYYKVGLCLLSGITLNQADWRRITLVMPVKYQAYFEKVKK